MRKMTLLLMGLMIGLAGSAQNHGEIKGRVIDSETGEPIVFASVFVESGTAQIGGYTDENGGFRIKPLDPGTYDLHVRTFEYADLLHKGILVRPGEITILNTLSMQSSLAELPPVVVTTYTIDLVTADNPGKMSISAPDLVKRADVRNTTSLVANLIPGVTQGQGATQELHFRGARPQNFATFIDGVKIGGGEIPSIPSNAINNLTVYTGGIPASYGDVTGGVVIIETKGYFDFYRASRRQ